jgi:hypothetical protein
MKQALKPLIERQADAQEQQTIVLGQTLELAATIVRGSAKNGGVKISRVILPLSPSPTHAHTNALFPDVSSTRKKRSVGAMALNADG